MHLANHACRYGSPCRIAAWVAVGLLMVLSSGCTTAYSAARDERSLSAIVDDKNIELKIKYALAEDKNVKARDISVYSYFGRVYLIGEVEQRKQRSRAIEIARGIEGVRRVRAHLIPKEELTAAGFIDDATITGKVKRRLIEDEGMKSTQVRVKTIRGQVFLVGLVATPEEIRKAVAHAKAVNGVRKVHSYLMTTSAALENYRPG